MKSLKTSSVKKGYKQTEIGLIPEDWDVTTIGSSIDLLTGFPFPSSGFSKSGKRLLRGSNIKRGVIDWSAGITEFWPNISPELHQYILKAGDIVVAMDGSLVGRSFASLSERDTPALLVQRVARIRTKPIVQSFLKILICSHHFTSHCDTVKTVTAIPHISSADIKSFKIPLPPTKAEQEAIAEALSDADALVESLEQLIEKKRLIKQGTMQELLSGKRRLPGFQVKKGYKQTEIGPIPEDWDVKTLGCIAERIIGGGTPNRTIKDYWNGDIPWMSVKDFAQHNPHKTLEYITSKGLKNSATHLIPANTIITSTRMALGKAVLFAVDVTINQDLKAIFPNKETNTRFLYYWFQFNETRIAEMGSGSTVMGLSVGDLRKITFLKPQTNAEQEAIAGVLSSMDEEITELEEKLEKTRQIKQGMMQELLTGRIRLV